MNHFRNRLMPSLLLLVYALTGAGCREATGVGSSNPAPKPDPKNARWNGGKVNNVEHVRNGNELRYNAKDVRWANFPFPEHSQPMNVDNQRNYLLGEWGRAIGLLDASAGGAILLLFPEQYVTEDATRSKVVFSECSGGEAWFFWHSAPITEDWHLRWETLLSSDVKQREEAAYAYRLYGTVSVSWQNRSVSHLEIGELSSKVAIPPDKELIEERIRMRKAVKQLELSEVGDSMKTEVTTMVDGLESNIDKPAVINLSGGSLTGLWQRRKPIFDINLL